MVFEKVYYIKKVKQADAAGEVMIFAEFWIKNP